jgi:hypothetical protein
MTLKMGVMVGVGINREASVGDSQQFERSRAESSVSQEVGWMIWINQLSSACSRVAQPQRYRTDRHASFAALRPTNRLQYIQYG